MRRTRRTNGRERTAAPAVVAVTPPEKKRAPKKRTTKKRATKKRAKKKVARKKR